MALKGDKIVGKIDGISDYWLGQLNSISEIRVPKDQLFSEELAYTMAKITQVLQSEICVYIDRRGRIVHTQVGDKHSVSLESMTMRNARHHLSGLRCVHTHPNGNGMLSEVDLTSMPMLRFDAMIAIGVDITAKKEDHLLKTVGVAFGVLGDAKPKPFLCRDIKVAMGLDYLEMVTAIEKVAAKTLTHFDLEEKPTKALLVNITGKNNDDQAKNSLSAG